MQNYSLQTRRKPFSKERVRRKSFLKTLCVQSARKTTMISERKSSKRSAKLDRSPNMYQRQKSHSFQVIYFTWMNPSSTLSSSTKDTSARKPVIGTSIYVQQYRFLIFPIFIHYLPSRNPSTSAVYWVEQHRTKVAIRLPCYQEDDIWERCDGTSQSANLSPAYNKAWGIPYRLQCQALGYFWRGQGKN